MAASGYQSNEEKETKGLIHNSGLTFQAQFPQPIPVTLF